MVQDKKETVGEIEKRGLAKEGCRKGKTWEKVQHLSRNNTEIVPT